MKRKGLYPVINIKQNKNIFENSESVIFLLCNPPPPPMDKSIVNSWKRNFSATKLNTYREKQEVFFPCVGLWQAMGLSLSGKNNGNTAQLYAVMLWNVLILQSHPKGQTGRLCSTQTHTNHLCLQPPVTCESRGSEGRLMRSFPHT